MRPESKEGGAVIDLLHLIDRLEELIGEARRLPIGTGSVIDRRRLLDLVDQLRAAVPAEVREAQELLERREDVLAKTDEDAALRLSRADDEVERRLSESELVKTAQSRAGQIIAGSQAETDRLLQEASQKADGLRAEGERLAAEQMEEADRYALEMLMKLDQQLGAFSASVRAGIDTLDHRPDDQVLPDPPPALPPEPEVLQTPTPAPPPVAPPAAPPAIRMDQAVASTPSAEPQYPPGQPAVSEQAVASQQEPAPEPEPAAPPPRRPSPAETLLAELKGVSLVPAEPPLDDDAPLSAVSAAQPAVQPDEHRPPLSSPGLGPPPSAPPLIPGDDQAASPAESVPQGAPTPLEPPAEAPPDGAAAAERPAADDAMAAPPADRLEGTS